MKKILQKLTSSCKQILPGLILGVMTTFAFTLNALGQDTQAPTVPAGLSSYCITAGGFVLSWNKSTDDVGVTTYEVFQGAVSLGTATAPDTFKVITTLSASSTYSYTVTAKDLAGNTSAASTALSVTTAAGTLPSPWLTQDIGSVGKAGSVGYVGTNFTFSLAGSGTDIGEGTGYSDQFRYVYQTITGNFDLVARVIKRQPYPNKPLDTYDTWQYAGLDVRESLDGASKNVSWLLTQSKGTHGLNFQTRATNATNGNQTNYNIDYPLWLRLTRSNDTIRAMFSNDGTKWTRVDSSTFHMAANLYVGLAVCSTDNTKLAFASFDKVSALEATPPTAPTGLTKSNITNNGVTLTWTASTDNVAVTEYDVFQNQGTTPVAQVLEGLVSTTISGLSAGTTYSFTVKAKDAAGNFSAPSTPVSVTTTGTATATPTITASSVQVYPNPTSGGVDVQVNGHSTISILDVNGKLLVKKIIEKGTTRVPLNLKSGLYYVRIVGENNSVSTSKLMVE